MTRRATFVEFCLGVLGLKLSPAWRVLLRVSVDGVQPRDLDPEERALARELFGDVDEVPESVRRLLVWRLGRGSGKTTIACALAVYVMLDADLSRVGPGMLAAAVVVGPTRATAKLSVRVARELFRQSPKLERLVLKKADKAEGFRIRRPDGREVAFLAVAASRGGHTLRGYDILAVIFDESEFFTSNDDTGAGTAGYAVSDRDLFAAALPRLIGPAIFISTPWPVETLTSELFEKNYGSPETAFVALGTSLMMRPGDAKLETDVANAMHADEESALREFFCQTSGKGASKLLDPAAVLSCVDAGRPFIASAPPGAVIGCGGDTAFERDSCAIVIVARIGDRFELLEQLELRPTPAQPLVPGPTIARFAEVMKRHGVHEFCADAHYRQSVIEHLTEHGLRFVTAPYADPQDKYDSYLALRTIVHSRRLAMPDHPRLVSQMKSVSTKPVARGVTQIVQPRRAGSGHCDSLSALVAAIWHAERQRAGYSGPLPEPIPMFSPLRGGW